MTDRVTIFQADIFARSDVGTEAQRKDILNQISKIKNEPAVGHSNPGCWRSYYKYTDVEWLAQEVADISGELAQHYSETDPTFDNVNKHKKKVFDINYWTNVNQPGSRNTMHTHFISHFTAVYYLQGTDTGSLRIMNPANMLNCYRPGGPFVRDFYFTPKDGDLIIFPSWIPHEVDVNLSNRERINIAFDISIT
jgi:uncharacterized protein (TIGR02466 family)